MTRLFGPADDRRAGSVPARVAIFAYGLVAYACFFATIAYAIGFVGNLVVLKTIDSGPATDPFAAALVNAGLLSLFVVQHTVMARPAFKRWWTRLVPPAMERSTFVIAASACLALAFALWRPIPGVVWHVDHPALRGLLVGVMLAGWAIVFASSFMVSHWDLFGLRQVYLHLRGLPNEPISFRLVGLYRLVRHPLMLGFLIAFWATPTMTVGHLLFSLLTTAYIVLGVWFEERDLVDHFGERYLAYRRAVPAILPLPRRS